MSEFKKDNDIFNGKGEEEGKWITVKGSKIFIKDGQNIKQSIKEHFQNKNIQNEKIDKPQKNFVELGKQEYAELNSAIRTKFSNSIPQEGTILYGNNYYIFSYNRAEEKIVCNWKISISGNEDKIKRIERYFEDGTN